MHSRPPALQLPISSGSPCFPPLQWGAQELPCPPPGEVHVSWHAGCSSGPQALPAAARLQLERAAAAAEAALAPLPNRRFLVGSRTGNGWHVEVVPSQLLYCGARNRCIVITTATAACSQPRQAVLAAGGLQADQQASEQHAEQLAALLFLLGHEVAHGLAH